MPVEDLGRRRVLREDRRRSPPRRVGRAREGGRRSREETGRRQERDLLHQQPHAAQRPTDRHRGRSDAHPPGLGPADHGRGVAVPRSPQPARPGGVHRLSRTGAARQLHHRQAETAAGDAGPDRPAAARDRRTAQHRRHRGDRDHGPARSAHAGAGRHPRVPGVGALAAGAVRARHRHRSGRDRAAAARGDRRIGGRAGDDPAPAHHGGRAQVAHPPVGRPGARRPERAATAGEPGRRRAHLDQRDGARSAARRRDDWRTAAHRNAGSAHPDAGPGGAGHRCRSAPSFTSPAPATRSSSA